MRKAHLSTIRPHTELPSRAKAAKLETIMAALYIIIGKGDLKRQEGKDCQITPPQAPGSGVDMLSTWGREEMK